MYSSSMPRRKERQGWWRACQYQLLIQRKERNSSSWNLPMPRGADRHVCSHDFISSSLQTNKVSTSPRNCFVALKTLKDKNLVYCLLDHFILRSNSSVGFVAQLAWFATPVLLFTICVTFSILTYISFNIFVGKVRIFIFIFHFSWHKMLNNWKLAFIFSNHIIYGLFHTSKATCTYSVIN